MTLDNAARARRAAAALRAYATASRTAFRINEERITDLIIDLLHLAHASGATGKAVDQIVRLAHIQFLSERSPPLLSNPSAPLQYNPLRHESRLQ